ncbi:MAG TPA: rhodanese-like domain-containing protein [Candidatus Brocadiia bacterium]|nr:rhodanese-like domain-containing protein [Candidatus Brocadiia bacterium]
MNIHRFSKTILVALVIASLSAGYASANCGACGPKEKKDKAESAKYDKPEKCDKCGTPEQCASCAVSAAKPQTKCPVMGEKINKQLYADVAGRRIYVCCAGCVEKIKADPQKYIQKVIDNGETPESLPIAAEVSTATLAVMVRAGVPVVILDARTGKYDDGRRIPGAKSLSPEAKPEEMAKVAGDKKGLIVTYCAGVKCPASRKLAEKLRSLGYANVLEYTEGIQGWTDAGHEIQKKL